MLYQLSYASVFVVRVGKASALVGRTYCVSPLSMILAWRSRWAAMLEGI